MTLDNQIEYQPVQSEGNPTIWSIFHLDILRGDNTKYTDIEVISILFSILSIVTIPIFLIPFLCNRRIFSYFIWSLKNNFLGAIIYTVLFPIALIYCYLCIILYPFILMLKRM